MCFMIFPRQIFEPVRTVCRVYLAMDSRVIVEMAVASARQFGDVGLSQPQ